MKKIQSNLKNLGEAMLKDREAMLQDTCGKQLPAFNVDIWAQDEIRVVNHVHTKKVHAKDKPPNRDEFQGSLGGMYLVRMYMIYYSYEMFKPPATTYEQAIDEVYSGYKGRASVWSKRLPLGAVVAKGGAKVGNVFQKNTIFASRGTSLASTLSALKRTQGQVVAYDVAAKMHGRKPEAAAEAADPNNKLLVSLANSNEPKAKELFKSIHFPKYDTNTRDPSSRGVSGKHLFVSVGVCIDLNALRCTHFCCELRQRK